MHLWCFVLACKKTGYWTRRAVLIIASEAEEYADPHTKTHTKKTSAASRGFVVSSCWLPLPNARHNKLPSCIFFALCPFHRFFFCTLPVPSLFFYTLPVTSLFFCTVSVTLQFFCTLPIPSFFFTLCRSHCFFFCTLSVTSHFFLQFGGCFVFFCNPLSQWHFFATGRLAIPALLFFARRICIIRLLQFRLHFSLHFCIYFAFFRFSLFFYTLSFKLQKNATGKTHWFPLLFFCASVLGNVPGCIFRNPACEPIVGSHSLSQLCALPSSGGGVCDWRFSLEDSCQARTQQCTSYK